MSGGRGAADAMRGRAVTLGQGVAMVAALAAVGCGCTRPAARGDAVAASQVAPAPPAAAAPAPTRPGAPPPAGVAAPAPAPATASAAAGDDLDRLLAPRPLGDPAAAPRPVEAVQAPPPGSPEVVILGLAVDGQQGALVQDGPSATWRVMGLDAWPPEARGRRVEVKGRPATVTALAPGPGAAGPHGTQRVIVDARWRILL